MKYTFVMVGIVAIYALALAGNINAVNKNNYNGSTSGVATEQKTEARNQGDDNQTQTENKEEIQQMGENLMTPTEAQRQVQRGTPNGNTTETPVQNQGDASQIQNQEQEAVQTGNINASSTAEQRRSAVANAVQNMLDVADRNNGIGQQVRTIAQSQTQNHIHLEQKIHDMQSRSTITKFFIGPDYKNIREARELLEQNREEIQQLNELKNQLSNQSDQQNITEQLRILEQANLEIENSLNASQESFSLFGWLFRWLTNY